MCNEDNASRKKCVFTWLSQSSPGMETWLEACDLTATEQLSSTVSLTDNEGTLSNSTPGQFKMESGNYASI